MGGLERGAPESAELEVHWRPGGATAEGHAHSKGLFQKWCRMATTTLQPNCVLQGDQ